MTLLLCMAPEVMCRGCLRRSEKSLRKSPREHLPEESSSVPSREACQIFFAAWWRIYLQEQISMILESDSRGDVKHQCRSYLYVKTHLRTRWQPCTWIMSNISRAEIGIFQEKWVNSMDSDDLAPWIARNQKSDTRTSIAMVLTM